MHAAESELWRLVKMTTRHGRAIVILRPKTLKNCTCYISTLASSSFAFCLSLDSLLRTGEVIVKSTIRRSSQGMHQSAKARPLRHHEELKTTWLRDRAVTAITEPFHRSCPQTIHEQLREKYYITDYISLNSSRQMISSNKLLLLGDQALQQAATK